MPDHNEPAPRSTAVSDRVGEDLPRLLSLLSDAQNVPSALAEGGAPTERDMAAGDVPNALKRVYQLETSLSQMQADRDYWRAHAADADQRCADLRSRTKRALLLMIGLAFAALVEVITRA
jgi:hypothetical protein